MPKSRKVISVAVLVVLALLVLIPGVASAAPANGTTNAPSAGGACGSWYRIRWGDTLASIAARYGVTVSHLQSYNGIANRDRIYAGKWIRIPCVQDRHTHGHDKVSYPAKVYYYSNYYGCWGYSYYNAHYGRNIFICR
jgi:hypothetical protein